MKKVMWIVAMIPVVVTSVVLQFMPDIIPMHHDLEGNTDRWESKTESFIFRGIIRMCEQVAASGNTLILYSA